jgi:hypothetical protein
MYPFTLRPASLDVYCWQLACTMLQAQSCCSGHSLKSSAKALKGTSSSTVNLPLPPCSTYSSTPCQPQHVAAYAVAAITALALENVLLLVLYNRLHCR